MDRTVDTQVDEVASDVAELRRRHVEMYRALDDEAKEVRRHAPAKALRLPEGTLLRQGVVTSQYFFPGVTSTSPLRVGREVHCVFGTQSHPCTVISREGDSLVLALPGHHGNCVAEGGTLSVDTVWMLEALQHRLASSILSLTRKYPCTPAFNFKMASRVLGQGAFAPKRRLPSPAVFNGCPLNPGQRNAVYRAFGGDVTFVWGPPGTGKTITLARVVESHVRAGRSVLVLGPSNRSVDVLMRAVADRFKADPTFAHGSVLRFGAHVTAHLADAYGSMVCYEDVVARLRQERFEPAIRRVQEAHARAMDDVTRPITLAPRAGGRDASSGRARRRRTRASIRVERLAANLEVLRNDMNALPGRLLRTCSVLGTTIHQTYVSPALTRQYDVVVVDEVSMAQTTQVYVAASLATQEGGRVVLAGDFRQLPSVVTAKTARAAEWLGTDIFHRNGIPDDLQRDDIVEHVAVLETQYRMSPGICSVVNQLFYDGRLDTAPSVRARLGVAGPLGDTDLFCVDTSAACPRVTRVSGGSRMNEVHVHIIEDLLAVLDSGGTVSDKDGVTVSVITPYVEQAKELHRVLGFRYRGRRVHITTAHQSQGGEADVVILDLTDAAGLPLGGFLAADRAAGVGARLLNVSLSRAKRQLYVVGDMSFLARTGGRVVKDLVRYLQQEAQLVRLLHIRGSAAQVYGSVTVGNPPTPLARRAGGR